MHYNIFTLHAEIIELYNKPTVPVGNRITNVSGETINFVELNSFLFLEELI